MKKLLIIIVLVALGWFGWEFAKDKGWVGRASSLGNQLDGQKSRQFNKVE